MQLGSLVARIVFLPVEEITFSVFSKLLSEKSNSTKSKEEKASRQIPQEALQQSHLVLKLALKLMIFIGTSHFHRVLTIRFILYILRAIVLIPPSAYIIWDKVCRHLSAFCTGGLLCLRVIYGRERYISFLSIPDKRRCHRILCTRSGLQV